MPKGSKKAGGRVNWQRTLAVNEAVSDVTLNDFANSKVSSKSVARLKKSTTSALVKVQRLRGSADDSLAWYEKTLEDFDVDLESETAPDDLFEEEKDDAADENFCKNVETVSRGKRWQRKDKKMEPSPERSWDEGYDYPLDLWYLIAEFVHPEDVALFACICKSSFSVVNSVKFWISLYKRYYKQDVTLPQRLQPECVDRPRGLRACVVRALFHMYPPFVERCRLSPPLLDPDQLPHGLVSSRCLLMWHQSTNKGNVKMWNFYFKFHREDCSRQSYRDAVSKSRLPDLLQMLTDMNSNSENGCRVLQISCQNFVSIPVVMGMALVNVNFNMSQDLLHYRLRMTFAPSAAYCHSRYRANTSCTVSNGVMLTLEPVLNIKVLNWWHPQYPMFNE